MAATTQHKHTESLNNDGDFDVEAALHEIRDITITTNRVFFIVMMATLIFGLILVFLPYTSKTMKRRHADV